MLRSRSARQEFLDGPDITPEQVRRSLDFMGMVNRWFGGAKVITDYFERAGTPDQFTVDDLGSGGGDLCAAVCRWADARGKQVRIRAYDTHPVCIAYARSKYPDPRIEYIQADALADASSRGPADYLMTSMFAHHLSDVRILELLKKLSRQAVRGFIVNDLARTPAAAAGAAALGLASLSRVVTHDAVVSVARGFGPEDLERYRTASGIEGLRWDRHPWFRVSISLTR